MSVLSSLLVLCCVCVSLVVATSEPNHDHVIISNHFTNSAAAAAHSFRTLQSSSPTSFKGISDVCQTTTAALESNTDIQAAKRAVIASGCTEVSEQSCSTITRSCTCITSYSNDATLRSLVAQSGGRVCPLNMQLTAYMTKVNIDMNYQGILGLQLIGSGCTNTDMQTMLSLFFDAFAEGARESDAKDSTSSNKVQSITGTMSMCSTLYTGTRYINGAENNNKPIGCAIALLIGTITTIIMKAI